LAANEDSKRRGAMLAFNDRILSGFWLTKLTPNVPDAFGSTATGELGAFLNNLSYFYKT
jgi:L-asparaginase